MFTVVRSVAVWLVNLFIPDPIPFLDEVSIFRNACFEGIIDGQ